MTCVTCDHKKACCNTQSSSQRNCGGLWAACDERGEGRVCVLLMLLMLLLLMLLLLMLLLMLLSARGVEAAA